MDSWLRIQSLMEKTGISSRELAKIAGVVPSAVTKWKGGSSIRNAALSRIALHFGVSTDWLVTGRDGVTTKLIYGMREKLFEAKGATGLTVPGLAEKMGVNVREVERIMNDGGDPSSALSAAFERHLQPIIEKQRKGDPLMARLANIERLLVKLAGEPLCKEKS